MPQRGDLKRILILGSGPIVIGQACEFDYSGTQACKALRKAGYEIILINSNPASIMTDPDIADKTYIEPLTPEIVSQIIIKEKQGCEEIFISPIFFNKKNKSFLGIIKFNYLALTTNRKIIALGGINQSNINRLLCTKSKGYAGISGIKKTGLKN